MYAALIADEGLATFLGKPHSPLIGNTANDLLRHRSRAPVDTP